jgi:hypothetical protein
MSRKEYLLIAVLAVLAGLYTLYFILPNRIKTVAVEHTLRPSREAGRKDSTVCFKLPQGPFRLTALRVVLSDEYQTNPHAVGLWHLVSKNGSAPVDGFAYGFPLSGMTPFLSGAKPEPLKPGIKYLLLIETSNLKGAHEFSLSGTELERGK